MIITERNRIERNRRPTASGNDWDDLQALQQRVSVILEHLQISRAKQADLEGEQQALGIQIFGTKQRLEQFPEFYTEPGRYELLQKQALQWSRRLRSVERQLSEEHSQQEMLRSRYEAEARRFHRLTGYDHQSDRFLTQFPENFELDYVYPRKLRKKPTSMLLTLAHWLSGVFLPLGVLAIALGDLPLCVFLGSGLVCLWGLVAVTESL